MAKQKIVCPNCHRETEIWRNPGKTVDIIIEMENQANTVVLIDRKNIPFGWAIPGGYVDYGETVEQAAVREALEETSLQVELLGQFGVYSDPRRDKRQHNISTVFTAIGRGIPIARDDAKGIKVFHLDEQPENLCFDHGQIMADYKRFKETGKLPFAPTF